MTPTELKARWIAQRDEFAHVGALVDGARLVNEHLEQLAGLTITEESRALTLKEAADLSEYSLEYLARLIRQGRIPQARTKGRPRIYLKDLPIRRSRPVAERGGKAYDVNADARTLRDWR
jgi:hypothetical protein